MRSSAKIEKNVKSFLAGEFDQRVDADREIRAGENPRCSRSLISTKEGSAKYTK